MFTKGSKKYYNIIVKNKKRKIIFYAKEEFMEPKYVVYECENCGKLFYREVEEVLLDDAEHCDVKVRLIAEANSTDIEEFPMCACIGGDENYQIELDEIPSEGTEE